MYSQTNSMSVVIGKLCSCTNNMWMDSWIWWLITFQWMLGKRVSPFCITYIGKPLTCSPLYIICMSVRTKDQMTYFYHLLVYNISHTLTTIPIILNREYLTQANVTTSSILVMNATFLASLRASLNLIMNEVQELIPFSMTKQNAIGMI